MVASHSVPVWRINLLAWQPCWQGQCLPPVVNEQMRWRKRSNSEGEIQREIIDRSMSINTSGLVCLSIMLGNVMIVGGLIKAFHLCVCVWLREDDSAHTQGTHILYKQTNSLSTSRHIRISPCSWSHTLMRYIHTPAEITAAQMSMNYYNSTYDHYTPTLHLSTLIAHSCLWVLYWSRYKTMQNNT